MKEPNLLSVYGGGERRHPWLAQGHNLKTTEKPSHPESNKRAFGKWARRNHDKPGHTQTRRYRFPFLASSSLGKPWQGHKWCLFTQEGIGNNPTPEEEKESKRSETPCSILVESSLPFEDAWQARVHLPSTPASPVEATGSLLLAFPLVTILQHPPRPPPPQQQWQQSWTDPKNSS